MARGYYPLDENPQYTDQVEMLQNSDPVLAESGFFYELLLRILNNIKAVRLSSVPLDSTGKLPAAQLPAVIDCGVWGALPEDVAAHNAAPMAHQALIVDGNNVNGIDVSQTLEEHMTTPYAHQNLIVDGNNT